MEMLRRLHKVKLILYLIPGNGTILDTFFCKTPNGTISRYMILRTLKNLAHDSPFARCISYNMTAAS